MSEDAGYVASFLRDADRDRYFATLLLKEPERTAIQSLYAFSADVASIRDRAREPTAGEIRLQWWADALKGTGHGNVRQNPLAAALLDAMSRYGLPSGPLLRLVAARLKGMPVTFTSIHTSRLTRARESARVLGADFPNLAIRSTPLLSECTPPTWRADVMADEDSTSLADCTAQLEAAWKEFTTAQAAGLEANDILVCHGNVIRWFVTKALRVEAVWPTASRPVMAS